MKRLQWFLMIVLTLTISVPSTAADPTPDWVIFPGEEWQTITPEEAGLDVPKFNAWVASQNPQFGKAYGGQKPGNGGVVITRGGYLVHTWGDPDFKYQSASLGKTFTRMALQLAIDKGLINSHSDRIMDYWTGEGELTHTHKYLNQGHHQTLTFYHLTSMMGGFPVTNGNFWEQRQDVPSWANWTGNPDYDNYAHAVPGEYSCYSSGGYWRLSQALTAIWDKELKKVLDEELFNKIGIPADRWEWLTGQYVRDNIDFYPEYPGYGGFIDPPYTINGHAVQGGGGWVVMSAKDFARVGLLIATGGEWEGQKLISEIRGNVGVNANTVNGWGLLDGKDGYFSFGKVATGFSDPTGEQMASWIVGPIGPIPSPRDLNNDGEVNTLDVQLCVNVLHEIEKDPKIIQRADVNRDGIVDGKDILLIIDKILEG